MAHNAANSTRAEKPLGRCAGPAFTDDHQRDIAHPIIMVEVIVSGHSRAVGPLYRGDARGASFGHGSSILADHRCIYPLTTRKVPFLSILPINSALR